MDRFLQANRARWDELVPIHASSDFYDIDGFRAGACTLDPIVRHEIGDVDGKTVLHLQCHFGLDTMSLARLGAEAVGVDFSEPAIEFARRLATEVGLSVEFICCDVYHTTEHTRQLFDIVFSSYGVLTWLPDLTRWARTVASSLAPGGRFHLVELHPYACMFDDESTEFRLKYAYFRGAEPLRIDREGSYAARDAHTEHQVTFTWPSSLSEVISALLDAGLRLDSLREYATCPEQFRPGFVEDGAGTWRMPAGQPDLPLVYSLSASKPFGDASATAGGRDAASR